MKQGYAEAKTLRFREDGTFKIVQFTDPEFYEDGEAEHEMEAMMLSILETERPDLVVYTGDYRFGQASRSGRAAHLSAELCQTQSSGRDQIEWYARQSYQL